MRRFALNRWWVLLLASALAIGTLSAFASPAAARGIAVRQAQIGGLTSDYGDPDFPNGVAYPGRMGRTGGISERRVVGDDRMPLETGALRLRILLELMRGFPLR